MKHFKLTTTFDDPSAIEIEDCDSVYGDIDSNTTTPFDPDLICEHNNTFIAYGGIIRCLDCHEVLGFARSNMCGNE